MAAPRLVAAGFTLVELVVVMIIVVTLAAVAISRTNNDPVLLSGEAERLAADIRYAQSLAMSRGERYWISFSGGASYQFNNITGVVAHPSGQSSPLALSAGTSFSLSGLPNSLITFDGLGRPYTDTAGLSLLSGSADVSMSKGQAAQTIRVYGQTGFARVCAVPATAC